MHDAARPATSLRATVLGLAGMLAATQAHAGCSVTAAASYDLGTKTTGQAAAGISQSFDAAAGLRCTGVLLSLLSSNRTDATVHSANAFKLVSDAGKSVTYVASPLSDGSRPIAQDQTVRYSDPSLIGLLSIGNSTTFDLPISFLSFKGSDLDGGVYRDVVTVDWDYRVCDGVALTNLVCLFYSSGKGRTVISMALTISDRRPTITITTQTVSDPVNGSSRAKAIPGSTVTTVVVVQNPDVVPLGTDSIVLSIPAPTGLVPATASADAVSLVQGDGMSLVYSGPSSNTDDVDFACGTQAFTCSPGNGQQVSRIRTRVKGMLKAGSSVTVTIKYTVI